MVHFVFPVKDDFEQKMGIEGGKHLLWHYDTALERLENKMALALAFGTFWPWVIATLALGHRPLLRHFTIHPSSRSCHPLSFVR